MNGRKTRLVDRDTMHLMVRAALNCGELRFARQAAFAWLAAFPGDLEMRLLQARVIFAGEHPEQAVAVLEQIINRDPEYRDAHEMLMRACRSSDMERARQAATCFLALGGKAGPGMVLPGGPAIHAAYRALQDQAWDELEKLLPGVMDSFPSSALVAVIHLRLGLARQDLGEITRLAESYHDRWPECLAFQLALAVSQIELGQEEAGVSLLHQCASSDSAGQVARRMWGQDHPYRSLWPDSMVIPFDFAIPAAVAGRLGWNQLEAGGKAVAQGGEEAQEHTDETPLLSTPEPQVPAVQMEENVLQAAACETVCPEPAVDDKTQAQPAAVPTSSLPEVEVPPERANGNVRAATGHKPPAGNASLKEVEAEFERLAKRLKQPALAREDGRYPVYVIFTTRNGLTAQYGAQTTAILDQELRKLAGLIRLRVGWEALVFYADDAECVEKYGLLPVPGDDPWKLKLLLGDLDRALARCGEMVGAVLIVGGETIVPFHQLPNPTDDVDRVVPSDSPYGTLDANYFVPDWPVGRLPGEPGPDAGFLLERIRKLQKYHGWVAEKSHRHSGWQRWLGRLWRKPERSRSQHGVGYTAAVWRRSSMAVFRPIGAPHTLLTSPPEDSGSVEPEQFTSVGLGYYNLHGVEDSEAWYGQADPTEPCSGPDYPVALLPKHLRRNGKAPKVVFSEACYGGHIFGKTENQSLALKFLGVGTLAVVASTCIAYGSISTPLIAADLLGSLFWKHLKLGRTAGEALMQARIDLAREMNRRQGYLDGEDQKALISFVLYGDPLAAYNGFQVQGKVVRRTKDHMQVKTITEQEIVEVQFASSAILKQAKVLAAEYLPGADLNGVDGLDVRLRRQNSAEKPVPPGKNGRRKSPPREEGRLVVTVSKQVRVAHHIHRHYVRVTLDEGGKPVKLAISR